MSFFFGQDSAQDNPAIRFLQIRALKNSLVARFIDPFSYKNLTGQGTFSTLSTDVVWQTDNLDLMNILVTKYLTFQLNYAILSS